MTFQGITGRVLFAGLVVCLPAVAQFFPIATPLPPYTAGAQLLPITGADDTQLSSLSGGGQTLTFSTSLTALTVGPTGGWAVWGSPPNTEGGTPRVVATPGNQTNLTVTLSSPVNTFGFEVEPANSGGLPATSFAISATFFNGSTVLGTVTRSVTFNSALLEAASSATPITSVQITAPAAAGGWAIAQFRTGNLPVAAPVSVPTVGIPGLAGLALLLGAAGCALRPVRT
jgi:hypothetical protein